MSVVFTGSGGVSFPTGNTQPSAGKFGQTIVTPINARYQVTSTSFVAYGPTVTITPVSSSSRIFLQVVLSIQYQGYTYMTFMRNTSTEVTGTSYGLVTKDGTGTNWWHTAYTWMDSPATTSAVTYNLGGRVNSGYFNINDNSDGNYPQFIVTEILP
jgi:hypothetical protein